jgi:glycosyltransferase involved in cell wall biosynthesis
MIGGALADLSGNEDRMLDVLLPFYGDPGLLRLAVRSVLDQHAQEWRLVIVDDCYPDRDVQDWCTSLEDERVTYHRNETNLGANRNYERALSYASADYVTVMGADDLMLPNYVDLVLRAAEEHDTPQVIQPGVSVVDGAGRPVAPLVDRTKGWLRPRAVEPVELRGESLATRLLLGNWTYFPSLCWHRETISRIGFRPGFDVVQDLALLLDVCLAGGRLLFDPELAFLYRRHATSDSGVRTLSGHRFDEERRVFADFGRAMEGAGWPRAARAARVHLTSRLHAGALLPRALGRGDLASARQLARHGLGR